MNIKLDRPIAVFDIESTGTNCLRDRIIDLGIVIIYPDGKRKTLSFRINPGIPIPPESSRVHGIRDEDVESAPAFKDIAAEVCGVLEDCDLAGFNAVRYDIPMLCEEFARAGVSFQMEGRRVVDAQIIFHLKEPRDLSAALKFYCGEMHLGAHGALDDVEATIRVLDAQLQRYPELPRTISELDAICNPCKPEWIDYTGKLKWEDGEIVINFGSKQGSKLRSLAGNDPGYLNWMLKKDFSEKTKQVIQDALAGKYPDPPEIQTLNNGTG